MKSNEINVHPKSDIFFYNPSTQSKHIFFYPICLGHYYYEKNYQLIRNSYDSFLLMYILDGECTIKTRRNNYTATKGNLVFIDCYEKHEYSTIDGWESLWIHFEGPLSRDFYNLVADARGEVVSLSRINSVENYMYKIFHLFKNNQIVQDAIISNYINNILTELIVSTSEQPHYSYHSNDIVKVISYINEHPSDLLSIKNLASLANLSPYYFARLFKKETGITPHDYILISRINHAKFYLKTTQLSIEQISNSLGFPTASSFCVCFKKYTTLSPLKYRQNSAM